VIALPPSAATAAFHAALLATVPPFFSVCGSDEGVVALIAHELGHALSSKPQTEKKGGTVANSAAWKAAVAADGGKALTSYGAQDPEESYADAYSMFLTERETMRILRPKQFEFFTKNPSGQAP